MYKYVKKITALLLVATMAAMVVPPDYVYARTMPILPPPGQMLSLSTPLTPPALRGLKVNPENPFRFDFILDGGDESSRQVGPRLRGDDTISIQELEEESRELIQYFLAALTTPEEDIWVNLSPHEPDRIVPQAFGQTTLGRDLLAQDYLLKQLTASLLSPEDEVGRRFWDRVYQKAFDLYGTTEIPVDTFHKVWIVPERASVYQDGRSVFVTEAVLDVKLERDFFAENEKEIVSFPRPVLRSFSEGGKREPSNQNSNISMLGSPLKTRGDDTMSISTQIMREVLLPEIKREVNEGTHFAPLRQIYHTIILAKWYKTQLKESIVNQVYGDRSKGTGKRVESKDVEEIYEQYVQAFKEGVVDFIGDEMINDERLMANDPNGKSTVAGQLSVVSEGSAVPRRYFSGGANFILKDLAMSATLPTQINNLYHLAVDALPQYAEPSDNDSAMVVNKSPALDEYALDTMHQMVSENESEFRKRVGFFPLTDRFEDYPGTWDNIFLSVSQAKDLDQVRRFFMSLVSSFLQDQDNPERPKYPYQSEKNNSKKMPSPLFMTLD